MKKRRSIRWLLLLCCMILALGLGACGRKKDASDNPGSTPVSEEVTIVEDSTERPSDEEVTEDDSAETSGEKLTEDDGAESSDEKLAGDDSADTSGEKLAEDDVAESSDDRLAEDNGSEPAGTQEDDSAQIDEDGVYTSRDEVALYPHTYGHLPDNFMTKKEAKKLGWSGGGLDGYADGCSIGGDVFGNYEGNLPDGNYHECDIDTMHKSKRGAKRIVYSDDGRIYYTEDHYDTFEQLY